MPHDRLHRLLPLLSLSTRPTSQTADGTTYDLDELLAEAEALLAEVVPPDDDSAARVAFEERLDQVRLRLRTLWAQQALLDSEEDLLVDALRALNDVLARADAVDVSRASSGSSTQPAEDSGSSTQPPAGSGSSTQPPDGGGEVDRNLMPPTPEDTGELIGQKRRRDSSSADPFDPVGDPDTALRTFGEVRSNLSAVEVTSALALLRDFVIDLATDRVAVFDIETTELIDRSTPLADMSISCASVLLLNPSDPAPIDTAEIVTFWNPGAKRGAPMELLAPMLDAAAIIVS